MFCPYCEIHPASVLQKIQENPDTLKKRTGVKLEKAIVSGVEIDFCPNCFGMFFEQNELQIAKDIKDENLRWLDTDLWQYKSQFKISKSGILCPACQVPFYEIKYGDSGIKVDICVVCEGTWLDRGEFREIINYLKQTAQHEILENYFKNLTSEIVEIFTGPETLKQEISDVLCLLKLLNYKFAAQYPEIIEIIAKLPK